jgi:hypothetical protein
MIKLLTFEPPDLVLRLDDGVLLRHLLVLGATGSGKTSGVITPILEQLLRAHEGDPLRRPGVLVLDAKGDAVHRVRTCAASADRTGDLTILGQGGEASYNLFEGFRRLDQLEHYTRRFLAGTNPLGPLNTYFTEARDGFVSSALTLLLAWGAPVAFSRAIECMRSWWFGGDEAALTRVLEFARAVSARPELSEETRRRLTLAFQDVESWRTMDPRLRDSHRSSLLNALRPLLTPTAQRFFSGSGMPFVARQVLAGKILTVSVNALTHPELAQLLMRLVSADFFEAVQSRVNFELERDRLVVLLADEFQLAVEPSWIEQLSTLRARGAAVISATQSLGALTDLLGRRRRDALICNFGSQFFFHSTEFETQELASLVMGMRGDKPPSRRDQGSPFEFLVGNLRTPICDTGALPQLKEHWAYIHLADGTRTEDPVWLAPTFISSPPDSPADLDEDDLARAVRAERDPVNLLAKERLEGFGQLVREMLSHGRRLFLTPRIVEGLCSLYTPRRSAQEVIESVAGLAGIRGIELLPAPWLAGFAGICQRRPVLVSALKCVFAVQGVVVLQFVSGIPVRERSSFLVHQHLNLCLYPSLFRPARWRHLHRLFAQHPEMKVEFASLAA